MIVMAVLYLIIGVGLAVTRDPPSGHNMGTGDSWIPVILCFGIGIVFLVMHWLI